MLSYQVSSFCIAIMVLFIDFKHMSLNSLVIIVLTLMMMMLMVTVYLLMLQLYKAEDVAVQRSSRSIGIEEFLFIMRRNKVCNSWAFMLLKFINILHTSTWFFLIITCCTAFIASASFKKIIDFTIKKCIVNSKLLLDHCTVYM